MVVGIPFASNAVEYFMYVIFYDSIDIHFCTFGKIPDLTSYLCAYWCVQFKNDSLGCNNQQYIRMQKLYFLFLHILNSSTSLCYLLKVLIEADA